MFLHNQILGCFLRLKEGEGEENEKGFNIFDLFNTCC